MFLLKLDLTLILRLLQVYLFSRFCARPVELRLVAWLVSLSCYENRVLCQSPLLFPHFVDMFIYTDLYGVSLQTFRSHIIAQDV
jgi:hypothetical protein